MCAQRGLARLWVLLALDTGLLAVCSCPGTLLGTAFVAWGWEWLDSSSARACGAPVEETGSLPGRWPCLRSADTQEDVRMSNEWGQMGTLVRAGSMEWKPWAAGGRAGRSGPGIGSADSVRSLLSALRTWVGRAEPKA